MTPSHILSLTRAAFRQEADELLVDLDAGLLALEAAPADGELINRVFRAMHTLKGSGATAGYTDVAHVLHDVEDIFNAARDGRAKITPLIVDRVLSVTDLVRRMLAEEQPSEALHQAALAAVAELTATQEARPGPSASLPEASARVAEDEAGMVWHVTFAPEPRIFHSGNDPAVMLHELLALGPGRVRARVAPLHGVTALDPECCYLSWEIQLASDAPREAVEEPFLFVADESFLAFRRIPSQTAWVLPAGAYFEPAACSEFRDECAEDIGEIEAHVLVLEEGAAFDTHLDALRRTLHNLKGLARLLLSQATRGVPPEHPLRAIGDLCHAAEGFLDARQSGAAGALESDAVELLLATADELRRSSSAFDSGVGVPWPGALLQRLGASPPAEAAARAPSADRRGPSMLLEVAAQCREAVSAFGREDAGAGLISADQARMLSRMLGALANAARFEGSVALGADITALASACTAASKGSLELGTGELERRYRELEQQLLGRSASLGPARAKTISLRPARPTSRGAPPGQPSRQAAAATGRPRVRAEAAAAQASVRVDQAKLDRMMAAIGELLIAKNALPIVAAKLGGARQGVAKELKEAGDHIAHIADELQDTMRQMRMLPVKTLFQRFPRMIRDLSRTQNKQVQLILSGEETELDKTVLEQMGDPLVHLVRNAVDHGIELPDERAAAGKNPMGTVTLEVLKEGSHVIMRISDDGRGMDPSRLRDKAVRKELLSATAAAALSDAAALELIFLPGFSTAEAVTNISGRGVGMDVVKSNVRQLHGSVQVQSQVGQGSVISVRLPSNLMVSKGILIECGQEQYALPVESIREMVKIRRDTIKHYKDAALINVRGVICPLLELSSWLSAAPSVGERMRENDELNAALVDTRGGSLAVVVDRFVAEIDVIAKPLRGGLDRLQVFQGATILGDGRVVLIIDPSRLDAPRGAGLEPARASAVAGASQ